MRKWLGRHEETYQNGQIGKRRERGREGGREQSEWRLEPDGEAEVSEIIIVSDAVEGNFVDVDGGSRREQEEAKLSRRGREILNEGEEKKKTKKKVIRVESEETQDYVKEAKSMEYEEEEERTLVPSAVSVPLTPLFRCDIQCSEKTLTDWQLAVVVNEGDEAYTTNLFQKCFNQHLQAEGEKPLTIVQWRQVVVKKVYRGRMWENDGKRTMFAWNVGTLSPRKKQSNEQAGIQGQWQQDHLPESTWSK